MDDISKSVAPHKAKLITITKWSASAYVVYVLVLNRFNVAKWSLSDWLDVAIRVAVVAVLAYCIAYWAVFCAVRAKEVSNDQKYLVVKFLMGFLAITFFFFGGPILLYLSFLDYYGGLTPQQSNYNTFTE